MAQHIFDSLIFDMDGTLWDAVDTYCDIWNETYRRIGVDASVTRHMLIECMGMPIEQIMESLAPDGLNIKLFTDTLRTVDKEIMPSKGGRLYPGVTKLIPELANQYKLFMVSNCGSDGLKYFMEYTGLSSYFTDMLTHGETKLPKEGNIRLLCQRHGLKKAIYIGDTDSDCLSAHAAGIPMVHTTYGFGRCNSAEYSADSFQAVADLFLKGQTL